VDQRIIQWLLDGDASIVFQTKRDLLKSSEDELGSLRADIENKGWAKRFLSYQDDSGMWGGGLYGPKWISTHYTLMTLMRLCLSPDNAQAQKGCRLLLDKGYFEKDGGINFFTSLRQSETCVSAMVLGLNSYFNTADPRLHNIKNFLLQEQMKDGGWNCDKYKGAIHSSFHTTISVLEGLRTYENRFGDTDGDINSAREKAHEFLLCHHLFKSDKTAEIVNVGMTRFSFPPRWKYDVLRSLDYFQEIEAPHDPRFCDAITLLRKKEKDGKWPLQQKHSGKIFFDMEKVGATSRINTLRALRILKWWDSKPRSTC
jgi:hypothetical protein